MPQCMITVNPTDLKRYLRICKGRDQEPTLTNWVDTMTHGMEPDTAAQTEDDCASLWHEAGL